MRYAKNRQIAFVMLGICLWSGRDGALAQNYVWTTFVGRAGNTNGGDGVGTNAFFNQPTGGAMDAAGNFYVPDEYNDAIRKVTPDGTVTTFAGKLGVAGTSDGTGGSARFTQPTNLIFDKDGNMYVVDTFGHTVRKITSAGVVTTLAGSGGHLGFVDGTGSTARFNEPNGIGYDAAHNVLYVADGKNGAIRKVTLSGVVTTVAGGGQSPGNLYYGVEQVAVSSSHRLYVCDAWNSTIWIMDTNGANATVLAGPGANHTWPNGSGSADGTGSAAQFSFPESLWLDASDNAFVADYGNDTIRKVTPAGVVTTIGGKPGVIGTADGTNTAARFNQQEGIFVDPWGNLYVADTQSSTIRIGYAGPPAIVSQPQSLTVGVGASPSFAVTAGGAAPTSAYQWRFNGTPLANSTHISGAQSNLLTLTSVTTNDAGTYLVIITNAAGATNVSATLTVTQAVLLTPQITWATPAAITYGTPLGASQLDASANVQGSFVYTPAAATILNAGTATLTAVFTPTDMADYSSATGSVSQVVSHAPLAVTASNAFRAYGIANPTFGGTLTGIQNSDNITATYVTTATPSSPVGTYDITPDLDDPNGRLVNYTVSITNGLLTVNQAIPLLSWSAPAAITYGTPLSGAQLAASPSVSGSVLYTPAAGAVLGAGTNPLGALFTPSDTVDYTSATSTVSLVVSPAPLGVTADSFSRAYGATNPLFTVAYSGFVNSESLPTSDVAGAPSLTSLADTTSPVSAYAITLALGSLTSTNYAFLLTNGTLTVTQALLSITASNGTKVFGQTKTFAGTEFTASGLLGTDSVTNVTLTSLGAPGSAAVADYPILASGATGTGLANYAISYVAGVLTVTPATPVTISVPIPLADGTIQLTFAGGDAGVAYRIQASSDLSASTWLDLSTNTADTNGLSSFTDLSAPDNGVRLYRTVTP